MPTTCPKAPARRSSGPPFAKRLRIGLFASLGVGALLYVYAFLVEGLPAADAMLLATILGAFVLLIALGVHTVATVYIGVMEAFVAAVVVVGAAAVVVLKLFG